MFKPRAQTCLQKFIYISSKAGVGKLAPIPPAGPMYIPPAHWYEIFSKFKNITIKYVLVKKITKYIKLIKDIIKFLLF